MMNTGWSKSELVENVIEDISPGWVVNVGIGMPSAIVEYAAEAKFLLHSENGLLGMGPHALVNINHNLIDPAKMPVTMIPGAALVDTSISFALMRGGHLDLSVMGAYQVSQDGDLANWKIPGRQYGGIGGAADLVAGAKHIWIMMEHVDKNGKPRLMNKCNYPLTGKKCVDRIYTNLGVFCPSPEGLIVKRLAPKVSKSDVMRLTDCEIITSAESIEDKR